jgi:hypothetical protein
MACFLVPLALAVITTLFRKRFPEKFRVNWLNALLWGGVVMLAVEHAAHGEIVPYPPFLTAGLPEVLPEMLTIGVPMATLTTLVWSTMVSVDLKFGAKIRRQLMRTAGTKTGVI